MRNIFIVPIVITIIVLTTRAAHAERSEYRSRSPPIGWFEFRAGPYWADLDRPGFYATFGREARGHIAFELDREFMRSELGSLAIGASVGYTRLTAKALSADGGSRLTGKNGHETKLTIFPATLVLSARLRALAVDYDVPLIPYAKLGLGAALWRSEHQGDGVRHAPTGIKGSGASLGPHGALGLLVMLDGLDRNEASLMSTSSGIKHSYLLAEYYTSRLGLITGESVGTSTWVLGLAFEM